MRISALSESPADEEAIYLLAGAVLRRRIDRVAPRRQRSGGVTGVLSELPAIIKELHYHTNVEALIVVVDSDDTPAHETSHDSQPSPDCRFCRLTQMVRSVRLPVIPTRPAMQIAVGIAVPAIEAWYLCGTDPHVVEAPFVRATEAGSQLRTARNELKIKAYGTDRPSVSLQLQKATAAISKLAPRIGDLERSFPRGFGRLAQQMRSWV